MDDEFPEARILRLQPGDVLLLTASRPLCDDEIEAIRDQMAAWFDDVPVCLLHGGVSLAVARRESD